MTRVVLKIFFLQGTFKQNIFFDSAEKSLAALAIGYIIVKVSSNAIWSLGREVAAGTIFSGVCVWGLCGALCGRMGDLWILDLEPLIWNLSLGVLDWGIWIGIHGLGI